jgi:hypothetical protein
LKYGEELRSSRGSIPPNTSRDVLLVTRRSPTTFPQDPNGDVAGGRLRRRSPLPSRCYGGDTVSARASLQRQEGRSARVLGTPYRREVAEVGNDHHGFDGERPPLSGGLLKGDRAYPVPPGSLNTEGKKTCQADPQVSAWRSSSARAQELVRGARVAERVRQARAGLKTWAAEGEERVGGPNTRLGPS